MLKAMNQFAKTLILLIPFLAGPQPRPAMAQTCAANWTTNGYKSFGDLQDEVKKRYGEVRILRVALCDQGGNPYFQVVIISGHGEVRRIQVGAAN
jgi:hypothetical protein